MKVADMVRENDPHWTVADTRRATKCAQRMMDTISTWDQSAIRERMEELRREDAVFAVVVYSLLPPPVRRMLNEGI